ncbi:hypothetical protein CJ030_MR5G020709 [Morella rubra]|uniref:Uncharacterized protein n=1 Tax=Morella rubra TaxID=262757 RepID=A0A6A1VI09_9ROSI|nr:hypothetical protein CJ030_MR5G020709 [Morella rubra]
MDYEVAEQKVNFRLGKGDSRVVVTVENTEEKIALWESVGVRAFGEVVSGQAPVRSSIEKQFGHAQKQCKQIGSVKGTPGVGPLMRADPATIRRAIIIRCLPSRLHDMGALLHWSKSNAQDSDYSTSFMKCPHGSNFGTRSAINSSNSPSLLARTPSMLHHRGRQVEDDSTKGAAVVVLAGSSSRKFTPGEQVNVGGLPESSGGSESVLGSRRNLLLEMPFVPVDELLPIQLSQQSLKSLEPLLVFSSPLSSQLKLPTKKKVGLKALLHALSPKVSFLKSKGQLALSSPVTPVACEGGLLQHLDQLVADHGPPGCGLFLDDVAPIISPLARWTLSLASRPISPVGHVVTGASLDRNTGKGKRKLCSGWDDDPCEKRMGSPANFSSIHNVVPTTTNDDPALGEDDMVLADLKTQWKKLNVKKHKVLTEMKNELLVLLQSAKSELES